MFSHHHNHSTPHTQGGALGSGSWDFASSLFEDQIRIVGDKGSLSFAVFDNGPVQLVMAADGKTELLGQFDACTPAAVHTPLVGAVVRDLQAFFGRKEGERRWMLEDEAAAHCRSTGTSALRTSAAMDSALMDYYGGTRDDAFWARPETWATGKGKKK